MCSSVRSLARFSALGLAAVLFAASAFAGNVIVVPPNSGPTAIQVAVNAALDGDTILVKTGTYDSFDVANKGLAIVGDTGHEVSITGAVRVRNLAAGKVVVLENLQAAGATTFGGVQSYGLYLADNAGSIRVQYCEFTGADPDEALGQRSGWDGATISGCVDVSMAGCTLRGGIGLAGSVDLPQQLPGIGGQGLRAAGSTVVLYATTVLGGEGENAGPASGSDDGGNANHACGLESSTLLASRCSFTGGNGGHGCGMSPGQGNCCLGTEGGSAGRALHLTSSLGRIQECLEVGGSPGCYFPALNCLPHCSGPIFARSGGTFVDLPSPARSLDTPTPVRENRSPVMSFTGQQPGDFVMVFISGQTRNTYRPAWEGTFLVRPRPPHLAMIVGQVPASGSLTMPLPLGALDPGVESKVLYLQPLFVDTQGNRRLGSLSTMVVVDSAF